MTGAELQEVLLTGALVAVSLLVGNRLFGTVGAVAGTAMGAVAAKALSN